MTIKEEKVEDGTVYSIGLESKTYSGAILKLIPKETIDTKDVETLKNILLFIKEHFPLNEAGLFIGHNPVFVDCGENFESIYCPNCKSDMTTDWQHLMGKASEKNFNDLKIITTCCNSSTNLDELDYKDHCGFSKIIFTVDSYQKGSEKKLIADIKEKFGFQLEPIFARY